MVCSGNRAVNVPILLQSCFHTCSRTEQKNVAERCALFCVGSATVSGPTRPPLPPSRAFLPRPTPPPSDALSVFLAASPRRSFLADCALTKGLDPRQAAALVTGSTRYPLHHMRIAGSPPEEPRHLALALLAQRPAVGAVKRSGGAPV